MPQIGAQTRVLALKEASFVVDAALGLLRAFQAQNEETLKGIQKVGLHAVDMDVACMEPAWSVHGATLCRLEVIHAGSMQAS